MNDTAKSGGQESELDRWLREDLESGRRAERHASVLKNLEKHGLARTQEAGMLRVWLSKQPQR